MSLATLLEFKLLQLINYFHLSACYSLPMLLKDISLAIEAYTEPD